MLTRISAAALACFVVCVTPASGRDGDALEAATWVVWSHQSSAVCTGDPLRSATSGRRLTGIGEFSSPEWSPEGDRLALSGSRFRDSRHGYTIRVTDARGRQGHSVTAAQTTGESDSSPAWSGDGSKLAFARRWLNQYGDPRRQGVWIVNLATREEQQIAEGQAGDISWSRDGTIAAEIWTCGQRCSREILLLTESGQIIRRLAAPMRDYEGGLSWSPDGSRLAVGGGKILDREGHVVGRYAEEPEGSELRIAGPAWSPDGSRVLFGRFRARESSRENADLYLGEPGPSGSSTQITDTPTFDEYAPAWRPSAEGRAGSEQPCLLVGRPGTRRDIIRGTSGDDFIDGGQGADVLDGQGGNDVILGGPGADVLRGGRGQDRLWGEAGNDVLRAGIRDYDFVHGGPGRDTAYYDEVYDTLRAVEVRHRVSRWPR